MNILINVKVYHKLSSSMLRGSVDFAREEVINYVILWYENELPNTANFPLQTLTNSGTLFSSTA